MERPRPDALKADLGLLCDELRACFGDLGYFPTRAELRVALRWAVVLRLPRGALMRDSVPVSAEIRLRTVGCLWAS